MLPFHSCGTKGTEYKGSKQKSHDSEAGSLAPEATLLSTLLQPLGKTADETACRQRDWSAESAHSLSQRLRVTQSARTL